MLPPIGTNSRRVLNLLRGVTRRTHRSITTCLSDISKPAIDRILQEQIEAGNIAQKVSGFRITQKAIDAYQAEEMANLSERKDNFKPLSSALFINTKSSREGSDWSRDVIESKHF